MVKSKASLQPKGYKTAPVWKPAIAVLGAVKAKNAVPELERLLLDPASDMAALILAVRALGRIGSKSSVKALEEMLRRSDLVCEQVFQMSVGGGKPSVDNALWKLELAAAEALASLGSPRPDLVAKHLEDERAVVRRYAAKVAEVTARSSLEFSTSAGV